MQFVSLNFAIFLTAVFMAHWLLIPKTAKAQNLFIFVVSIVFYLVNGSGYLALLLGAAVCNFYVGRLIFAAKSEDLKKWILRCAVMLNIGLLAYFKYFELFYAGISL